MRKASRSGLRWFIPTLAALLAPLASSASDTDICNDSTKQCCLGVGYWMGAAADEASVKEEIPNIAGEYDGYASSAGRLADSRDSRLQITVAATAATIALLILAYWLFARTGRTFFGPPGLMEGLLLVALPLAVSWFVPQMLMQREAVAQSSQMVHRLQQFCTNEGPAVGVKCGAGIYENRFGESDSQFDPDGYTPTEACFSPDDASERIVATLTEGSGSDLACAQYCGVAAQAADGSLKAEALLGRAAVVKHLMDTCGQVALNWRTGALTEAHWGECRSALTQSSEREERAASWIHQFPWWGGGAGLAVFMLLVIITGARTWLRSGAYAGGQA